MKPKTEKAKNYNNGIVEMGQIGQNIFLHNILSQNDHSKLMDELSKQEPELKSEIDSLILKIRDNILKCDPLQLLNYAQLNFLKSLLGTTSEFQLQGLDNIAIGRSVEYIQSVYVSCEKSQPEAIEDPSKLFFEISAEIEQLYQLVHQYYIAFFAAYKKSHEINDELLKEIFEAQASYLVRGHRYQAFELDYYRYLLMPHNDIFLKLFNMSSNDIIEGIGKLQYALSQGRMDPMNGLMSMFDALKDVDQKDIEHVMSIQMETGQKLVQDFFGVGLNDVCNITRWSKAFVKELSFGVGEYTDFFADKEYSGWPIIDLPIQKKPFIEIENQYYCFDYYSFTDNFYRAIQKMIPNKDPDYNWSSIQQQASESMTADVFQKLLPGCSIYKNNYYPRNKSLKQMCENDLIIQYYDCLMVVEIKAGTFVYTPPIFDFNHHIESYKKLIEESENQCQRTFDYLSSKDNAQLYNEDKTEKGCIDMSKISDIYLLSVTVDNINVFAARAEKLSFIKANCRAISIAIDDLMVYQSYFDSPLKFLHFLKNRRAATLLRTLVPTDELDHLGMYIKHNCYAMYFSGMSRGRTNPIGFREELDNYFTQIYHPQLNPVKPQQAIPGLFEKIIAFLDKSNYDNKVQISNYFLDFSSEAKTQFSNQIEQVFTYQKTTGQTRIISSIGKEANGLRYSCFISQPGVPRPTEETQKDYVLSNMVLNSDENRTQINLDLDDFQEIKGVSICFYSKKDIPTDRWEELRIQGERLASDRLQRYIASNGNKIGRNELCPCGSGKKYKKCCGRSPNQALF